MTTEDKIRKALHKIKTELKCPIPPILEGMLAPIIAEELDSPDVFVYKGWRCERIVIEKIPEKHRLRSNANSAGKYGYRCSKDDCVKYLPPESSQDVVMSYTKTRIDFWEEWFSVKETYEGVHV